MATKRFKGGGEIPGVKTLVDATTVRIIDGSGQPTSRDTEKPSPVLRPTCFDAPETGVKITKSLTAFQHRLYSVLAALYRDGEMVLTTARILSALRNSESPDAKLGKKIETSLKKLQETTVTLDLEREERGMTTRYTYKGSLLPMMRVSTSNTAEPEIRLLCEPPLLTCARELGRIIEIPREAFSGLSKTDPDFRLENYLMARISRMTAQNMDASREISFADIIKSCKKDARKPKSPARKKIKQYLNHYKECCWIAGYSEEEDGITIQL